MSIEDLFLLLCSICFNFPILSEWGYAPKIPIALVFSEQNEITSFVKYFSLYSKIIDVTTSVRTTKNYLTTCNSEGVLMILNGRVGKNSIKEMEKVEALFSAATIREVDGKKANVATFLVFEKSVPDNYKDSVFEIHIKNQLNNLQQDMMSVVPHAEQLSLVKDRIRGYKCDDCLPYKAAITFLYPWLEETDNLSKYEELLSAVDQLVEDGKLYRERNDIEELVIEQFEKYFNKNVCDLYAISQIDCDLERILDRIIIVKNESIFMDDDKFKEIIAPIINIIPIDEIKRQLQSTNFLQGNAGDYTVKMNYYIYDKLKRRRMLKFDLSKVETLKKYLYIGGVNE